MNPKFYRILLCGYYQSYTMQSLVFLACFFQKLIWEKPWGWGRLPFGKGRVKVNGFRIFIRFPDCANWAPRWTYSIGIVLKYSMLQKKVDKSGTRNRGWFLVPQSWSNRLFSLVLMMCLVVNITDLGAQALSSKISLLYKPMVECRPNSEFSQARVNPEKISYSISICGSMTHLHLPWA